MRNPLILLAVAPLLLGQGRPPGIPGANCGFGEGLAQLREAERLAALPVPGITDGRARGEEVLVALNGASATFRRCGCPRLVELTGEAIIVAESAPSEASTARLTQVFSQIRFRTRLVREETERHACR